MSWAAYLRGMFTRRRPPRPAPPAPKPAPMPLPSTRRKGERYGIWITAPTAADIDTVTGLGCRWLGIGPEDTWGSVTPLIDHAHNAGLNVVVSVQHSGHDYTALLADPAALGRFADWAAAFVDAGVDAIALLNEPNHPNFWRPQPDATMTGPAQVCDALIARIRRESLTVPVIGPGWSPRSAPLDPPGAQTRLTAHLTAQPTHCGLHPYVSWNPFDNAPADPWSYGWEPTPAQPHPSHAWNPLRQTPDVVAASGGLPCWITEHGEATDGTWTDDLQAAHVRAYDTAFTRLRTSGVPLACTMRYTLRDAADVLGLYTAGGTRKHAADMFATVCAEPDG